MTHTSLAPHSEPSETAGHMVELLTHHSARYPAFAEELQRHQALALALADQRRRTEHALLAWQAALARRWSCEVNAQRAVRAVQRQLDDRADAEAPYGPFFTPPVTHTPRGLLQEVRRLEAALGLIARHEPLGAPLLDALRRAGDELEAAIGETESCEAERRGLVAEQRLVAHLVERANERALRLLAEHEAE